MSSMGCLVLEYKSKNVNDSSDVRKGGVPQM